MRYSARADRTAARARRTAFDDPTPGNVARARELTIAVELAVAADEDAAGRPESAEAYRVRAERIRTDPQFPRYS